ncbi:MAG TPA: hypothetical protein VMS78_16835 [Rhizomicrobium sp.]|nr:hypothetical protein [Rhizomicrobium sp.]
MNPISAKAVLAGAFLVVLAGCAGTPKHPPVALNESDPHSTNPERIICRQLPPPTGSHISTDKEVCHTWAQWQEIEKRSQEAIRTGQRLPGQGGASPSH